MVQLHLFITDAIAMYCGLAELVECCDACDDQDVELTIDILKSFLDDGADPDERCNRLGWPVLMWVVEKGNKALVRLMIQYGANVHLTDHNGRTPLMAASNKGDKELVQLLIDAGSDVNKVWHDRLGRTALTHAVESGDDAVVRLLIQHGADTEARGASCGSPPLTPLEIAVVLRYEKVVRVLIEMGADPYFRLTDEECEFRSIQLEFKHKIEDQRKKAHMGLLRTMPMMMLWRKRATERLYHPSRIDFARILEEDD